jgi:hypothetical protein
MIFDMIQLLQLLVAMLLIYLITKFIVPLFFKKLKKLEKTSNSTNTKDTDYSLKIIDGIMPLQSTEEYVTTSDSTDDRFVSIPKSVNRQGGSQFSIAFWINKGASFNAEQLANKALVLFGLKNTTSVIEKSPITLDELLLQNDDLNLATQVKNVLEANSDTIAINVEDSSTFTKYNVIETTPVIVKCPMISFGEDGQTIIVSLNTIDNIETVFEINSTILSTLDSNDWNLLTFTFEDYKNPFGFSAGLKMTFYINNKQISTQKKDGKEMKLNSGRIYILPNMDNDSVTLTSNDGYIADVTYYNRAIKIKDIENVLSVGYNKNAYTTARMTDNESITKQYKNASLYSETQEI